MTKLTIFSTQDRKRFDLPPKFSRNEQLTYFALNKEILHILSQLRTVTNKVGFMLQYGYFKSHGKFYTADQFKSQDIKYVLKSLKLDHNRLCLEQYREYTLAQHRKKILSHFGWKPLDV